MLQRIAVCGIVLHRVALCCSVLQIAFRSGFGVLKSRSTHVSIHIRMFTRTHTNTCTCTRAYTHTHTHHTHTPAEMRRNVEHERIRRKFQLHGHGHGLLHDVLFDYLDLFGKIVERKNIFDNSGAYPERLVDQDALCACICLRVRLWIDDGWMDECRADV